MTFLVDANVLSEPTKPRFEQRVIDWLAENNAEIVVDPVVMGEIWEGIVALDAGKKQRDLMQWFTELRASVFCLDWNLDTAIAWAELREGFRWLLSRPDLGGVLLITTIINLGFNAAITSVIYALQQDGYPELLIGGLSATIGAVMLAGAVVAPLLVPRIRAGVLTIAGLSVVSVGAIVLSMVSAPWAIAVVLGASVLLVPALNAGMMGYFMVKRWGDKTE